MTTPALQPYAYESTSLDQLLAASPYQAYVYAYPHKTAYRPLQPARPLQPLWAAEARSALSLYVHLPFCEQRCGFCNLFTTVKPDPALVSAYLQTLAREARQLRALMGECSIAQLALGGGTPSYLSLSQLATLFDMLERLWGCSPATVPTSVELSPQTATPERVALLRERGVSRVSLGVQSFIEAEVGAVHRHQPRPLVEQALARLRTAAFPILNIDLMYGLPGQSVASWLTSLQVALRFQPEELFLYPLYVRPLTRLGHSDQAWDDLRLACYRAGRDLLRAAGYQQRSMRLFRAPHAPPEPARPSRCQEDGMVGLGCGARSYTRALHYASPYAVGPRAVNQLLRDYIQSPDAVFTQARYGFALDEEEQRRRYLLLSLLDHNALSLPAYRARFGSDPLADFPALGSLARAGLLTAHPTLLTLSERGLEYADAIGPWLFSEQVRQRMGAVQLQ